MIAADRLAVLLHKEWDRRFREPSEPGVPCPDCIDSATRILAAGADEGWTLVPVELVDAARQVVGLAPLRVAHRDALKGTER